KPEKAKETPTQVEVVPAGEPTVIGEGKLYTLGKEDVLDIVVQNQPEFSGRFVIGPDGKIQYSFVGDITAEGLNKDELKQVLIKKLESFVKIPEISIAIAEYRSKNVYILGEVFRPGKYPMKGDTVSLQDAIVQAGLPTPNAAIRRVYIVKSDPVKPTYRKIDLYKILYKGNTKDNINLITNDIVVVPSTVPSEINRALSNLLSPFGKAQSADALINHDWGTGDE
ncbi:MAG: polysaccharide biosynthesis/export family protein, partial [Candidatus Omnitrophota bacterium]